MRRHYAASQSLRLRVGEHCAGKFMLAIRLYILALTSLFLFLVIANRGLGILEAIVITCAIVYLILDVRTELQTLKAELQLLKQLDSVWSSSFCLLVPTQTHNGNQQQPKG